MLNLTFKNNILRYLFFLFILFIAAINFNLFLRPLELVTGGTQGIAVVLEHLLKFDPAIIILVINIIALIVSYFLLDKDTTYGTIVATFIYPIFVKLTSNITSLIPISIEDPLLYVLLTGVTCGITGGLVYKLGFSSGGVNVIALIIRKYFHIQIGITNFIVNTIIILLGGIYFGLTKCLYSIIVVFLNSYLINKIMLGVSKNKALYIKSKKNREIEKILYDEFKIEPLKLKTTGAYNKEKGDMLLIVIPTNKYVSVTSIIKEIDKDVFLSVNDSYEVMSSIENVDGK